MKFDKKTLFSMLVGAALVFTALSKNNSDLDSVQSHKNQQASVGRL